MAGITNLQELEDLLSECGCCPPARCCAPIVEYRARDCNSGAGGYPPLTGGTPGAEVDHLYTKHSERYEEHVWGSGYQYRTGDAPISGTSSIDELSWNEEVWQIAPMSLRRDHGFAWLLCTQENVTECEGSWYYRYEYHEDVAISGGSTWSRTIIDHKVSGTLYYPDDTPYCGDVVVEDTDTSSGSYIDYVPYIDSSGGTYAGDVDTCVRTENSVNYIVNHYDKLSETDETDGGTTYHHESDFHIYTTNSDIFSEPVTKADLIAFARDRMDDAANPWFTPTGSVKAILLSNWPKWPDPIVPPADPCDLPGCRTGICEASSFQYRLKLDKCCGYKTVRSEWSEVFLPRAYLEWLDEIESIPDPEDWPPEPGGVTVTDKVWVWEGTPPLCPDPESASEPYSDESMWSPWSATVKVPSGQEGAVFLWRYRQFCYAPLPDEMPGVFSSPYNLPEDVA